MERDEEELSRRLIGTLVNDNTQIDMVSEVFGGETVFRGIYQKIYTRILRLHPEGGFDWTVLLSGLDGKSRDVATECMVYAEFSATKAIATHLLELYTRRQISDFGKEAAFRAKDGDIDAHSLVDWAESRIFEIANITTRKNYVSVAEASSDAFRFISDTAVNGHPGGIHTWHPSLDGILGRMAPSNFVIVAGRPSCGKTATALDWSLENAKRGIGVGVFSLEMSLNELMIRCFSKMCHINSHRIALGKITNEEQRQIERATEELQSYPLYLEDCSGISASEVKSKARRLKHEKDVGLVVLDYIQLVSGGRQSSREQEISLISRTLKQTAKEIQTPVVALSQLSRAVEIRGGRPQLSDLRDSGSLEQDADTVILISSRHNTDETRIFDVAKHRNGPIGETVLTFRPEFNEFLEVA